MENNELRIDKKKVDLIKELCLIFEGSKKWLVIYKALNNFIAKHPNDISPDVFLRYSNNKLDPDSSTLQRAFGSKSPYFITIRNNEYLDRLLDEYIKFYQNERSNKEQSRTNNNNDERMFQPSELNVKSTAINSDNSNDRVSLKGSNHFNIPLRPSYFIGREKKLKEIHARLTNPLKRENILLLSGVGGMGKTTIMQEYLYMNNCRTHFNYIIVTSVNRDLESAFVSAADVALNVGVKDIVLQEEKLNAVLRKMKTCEGENLFVVDNINEQDYEDLLKMKSIFSSTGWKFLITSRVLPDDFSILKVDELELSEALYLFVYHYLPDHIDQIDNNTLDGFISKSGIRNDIELLLQHIARHTLLIELLGKLGKKKGISASQLFNHLKDQDLKHPGLERIITIGSHADSSFRRELNKTTLFNYILSIFDPDYLLKDEGDSIKNAENENKASMLRFFSVLPADDILIEDLKKLWEVDPQHENTFEDRLDELKQIGWLQGKQEKIMLDENIQNLSYKMHPLVQEVVFEKLKPDIQNCRPLVKAINKILPTLASHPQQYQQYAKSVIDNLNLLNK